MDLQYAVESKALEHNYGEQKAIDKLDAAIEQGEYVALVGRNGSGKSTFARLINALIEPKGGELYTFGMDVTDSTLRIEIRRQAGMVFQNPDNQIVASVVEEDIAFGPENLGIKPEEIRQRITEAMENAGLAGFEERAPHMLSGGQKQRVAVAGVLAMRPKMIIFDESTSMLDPLGKQAILDIMERLYRSGITVIHITHSMDEAARARRILVMKKGSVALDCTPRKLFSEHYDELEQLGLDIPQMMQLSHRLNALGIDAGDGWDMEELVENICRSK